ASGAIDPGQPVAGGRTVGDLLAAVEAARLEAGAHRDGLARYGAALEAVNAGRWSLARGPPADPLPTRRCSALRAVKAEQRRVGRQPAAAAAGRRAAGWDQPDLRWQTQRVSRTDPPRRAASVLWVALGLVLV